MIDDFRKTKIYRNPDVRVLVNHMRAEGAGYRKIADEINSRFGEKFTNHQSIKNYFTAVNKNVLETDEETLRVAKAELLDIPKQVKEINERMREILNSPAFIDYVCPHCGEKAVIEIKTKNVDVQAAAEIRKQCELVTNLYGQIPAEQASENELDSANQIHELLEKLKSQGYKIIPPEKGKGEEGNAKLGGNN